MGSRIDEIRNASLRGRLQGEIMLTRPFCYLTFESRVNPVGYWFYDSVYPYALPVQIIFKIKAE
jgi:hypothetical protein